MNELWIGEICDMASGLRGRLIHVTPRSGALTVLAQSSEHLSRLRSVVPILFHQLSLII